MLPRFSRIQKTFISIQYLIMQLKIIFFLALFMMDLHTEKCGRYPIKLGKFPNFFLYL